MGKINRLAVRPRRTRSPPAKSSSGRPRSSRSWSRTPSTPARAACPFTSSSAARSRSASRTTAKGWSRRTPGSRSSGTRPARFAAPTIWRRSSRSDSAARRCRRSRRCRTSCCGRAPRGAAEPAPRFGSTAARRVGRRGRRRRRAPSIEVNDLFYNLPARRKFLKSDAAESAQVSRITTQLALAYPEVGFTLTSGGRTVHASARRRRRCAIGSISCTAIATTCCEVHKEAGGIRLTGYIAALAEQGPTRGPQNVFINRRIVKDRTIAHAIIDAYSVASIKERSPEVHLFIEMPPDALDVNVHPTKAEVRFREQSLVHEVVRRALMDALGQSGVPQLQLRPEHDGRRRRRDVAARGAGRRHVPEPLGAGRGVAEPACRRRSPTAGFRAVDATDCRPSAAASAAAGRADRDQRDPSADPARPVPRHVHHRHRRRGRGDHRSACRARAGAVRAGDGAADRGTPRIAAAAGAAADRAAGRRRTRRWSARQPSSSASASRSRRSATRRSRCRRCRRCSRPRTASKALLALAEDLEGLDRGAQVQEALQRIAATTACHAAVKANYPLTYEKMTHILDELRATAYSTVCPHGRPVMLRLTRREIEKNFDRI